MEQEEEEDLEQEDFVKVFKSKSIGTTLSFLGKVSRACPLCGDIKLYIEFNNSRDPKTPCNYCSWEQLINEGSSDELYLLEDQIIENEREEAEALERQEIIDEVLRQLDE